MRGWCNVGSCNEHQLTRMSAAAQAYRNTVPVPRHWSQKRKYLQGKRGLEKPPFKLPAFIEATGISDMRQAYQEKVPDLAPMHPAAGDMLMAQRGLTACLACFALRAQEESKKLRQKQRDKTKPKMGKLDIDYQVSGCFPDPPLCRIHVLSSLSALLAGLGLTRKCISMHATFAQLSGLGISC